MSLFPYNNRKHTGYGSQGSPLDFDKAYQLAYDLFFWHSQIADTDDWTQSNEGAEMEIREIALGLITMTCEPSFVQMLADIGVATRKRLNTINSLRTRSGPQEHDDVLQGLGLLPKAGTQ